VSKELADQLINAPSAAAFLRAQPVAPTWQTIATLKAEVDRLIGADLKIAERLTDRIEQLAALTDDPCSRAFADASRARVLQHAGRYGEADALYESAINVTRRAKLAPQAAVIQMHRVFALTQMGRYEEALIVARAARRGLQPDSTMHLAQLETNIGIIHYRRDHYKKALAHYERAQEILAAAPDEALSASIDFNRSSVLTELDRHEEALTLLESAAVALERTGQTLWAAQARFHIAYLQFMRGNYSAALAGYHQSREQLTALGSQQLVGWCNQEIAEILLALNAFDDAAESAATARASFTGLGLPYEAAQATLVHALALMGRQQFDEARRDLEAAHQVFAESDNRMLVALVDIYLAELALRCNRPAEAAERASVSLRIFSRQKLATRSAYARTLVARAAYEGGDLKRARQMAKAALAVVEELYVPAVAYQCHHLLGRIERQRRRPEPALASFRRAVDTIEQMRGGIAADEFKASFLRDKIGTYEDAIAACLDADDDQLLSEAFRLVESSKSRALADLLARYAHGPAAAETALQPAVRARLVKLIEDLNWYNSQAGLAEDKGDQRSAEVADRYRHAVARCERQVAQLFRQVEIESPAFAEFQRQQTATVGDLCDTLQNDETVVEYFTTGEHVSAFIASRQGLRVARHIATKRDVEQLLMALRFQIEKFNYGAPYIDAYFNQLRRATNETLSALYEHIFAPLKSMINGSQLIIIPHGELHYIPFHALKAGEQYLIDTYEISYAPSASVLKLCRARRASAIANEQSSTGAPPADAAGDGLLVALGLAESGTPSIEEEIRQLALLFPNTVTLTGDAATRENLFKAAPAARFLHLASHGFFRRDNPMFSFLKLANGQLNFYSLLDLQLNAEMVTLSACHTGVNKVFPGDELHGLMRGFLYAGAPSVIASLWAVSDQSTAELMREMYAGIRAGLSKRAALRGAQLAIKEAYGHPYYWAPFVLMGEPE
jgi:CHAT domain-containing protein